MDSFSSPPHGSFLNSILSFPWILSQLDPLFPMGPFSTHFSMGHFIARSRPSPSPSCPPLTTKYLRTSTMFDCFRHSILSPTLSSLCLMTYVETLTESTVHYNNMMHHFSSTHFSTHNINLLTCFVLCHDVLCGVYTQKVAIRNRFL